VFRWGDLKEVDLLEDLDVGGKIILKCNVKEIWWEGVDRIYLAPDKDGWLAFVNTIMDFRVP
jgi:hypothetical protein